MNQQLARDAQPDVGSDQFACVKAVFRRLVPVGLHLAGHRCHCVVRQAGSGPARRGMGTAGRSRTRSYGSGLLGGRTS